MSDINGADDMIEYENGSDAENRADQEAGFGWNTETIGLDGQTMTSDRPDDEVIAWKLHGHLADINPNGDEWFILSPGPTPHDKGMKGDGSVDFSGWLPLVEIVRFVRKEIERA